MKTLVLLLFFTLCFYYSSACGNRWYQDLKWTRYKETYRKCFSSEEEETECRLIYEQNIQLVIDHNRRYTLGLELFEIGLNELSDLKDEEITIYINGSVVPTQETTPVTIFVPDTTITIPVIFDWRTRGVITEVKHQKKCGCDWAFAATAALEAHYRLYYGKTLSLSEQQLLDCDRKNEKGGGWVTDAYAYISTNGGLNYDVDYPYIHTPGTCSYNSVYSKITVTGYGTLQAVSEETLKFLVYLKGPVTAVIDASGNFHRYKGGIYYNSNCSSSRHEHAVLIVGFGTEGGQDYWLIKNSWGKKWGIDGYMKLARNRDNHCGIASKISYPVF